MTATNENVVAQNPTKVTVNFERTVQIRPYETAKASIFVSLDAAGTWNDKGLFVPDEGAINEAALSAFFEAKVQVLKQLNLDYEVIDNVVLETIDRVLGPTEVVETKPAAAASTAPKSKAKGGGSWGENPPSTKEGLYEELLQFPERYFDNRESKKSPKAPDFKRKFSGDGIWLDRASDDVKAKYEAVSA